MHIHKKTHIHKYTQNQQTCCRESVAADPVKDFAAVSAMLLHIYTTSQQKRSIIKSVIKKNKHACMVDYYHHQI